AELDLYLTPARLIADRSDTCRIHRHPLHPTRLQPKPFMRLLLKLSMCQGERYPEKDIVLGIPTTVLVQSEAAGCPIPGAPFMRAFAHEWEFTNLRDEYRAPRSMLGAQELRRVQGAGCPIHARLCA